MQSPLRQHLSTSLYHEIVLDGPKDLDKQGVLNFLKVLEWRLNNNITDTEFSHLYKKWLSSDSLDKSKEPFTKKNMYNTLQHKSELELLSMLGLLVREDNYTKLKAGHTAEWCKAIEQLFWMLDEGGRGYATQDEILFLLLAIVGNPIIDDSTQHDGVKRVTVSMAQQHTFYLMKEFSAKGGLVTLKRFKSYFDTNGLDLESVQRSIASVTRLLHAISSHSAVAKVIEPCNPQSCQHSTVPKLWEKAIYQAIDHVHNSLNQFDDVNAWGVVDFLLTDAFEVRFGVTSEKPHWKLSLQLFKSFTLLHGYVSPIEYTKDSIFKDQNFMLIQQTLRFYDDLLSDILDTLFPCDSSNINSETHEPILETTSEDQPVDKPHNPVKLALGEYTAHQVAQWLAAAKWIDVVITHENEMEASQGSVQLVASDMTDEKGNLEEDSKKHTLVDSEDLQATVDEHIFPSDYLSTSGLTKNSALIDVGVAVENITPTYLHSILGQSTQKQATTHKQHTPTLSQKIKPQITADTDNSVTPIGVVPISKIPHKENIKQRRNLRK